MDTEQGLICTRCNNVHDFDEAPDEGFCYKCGATYYVAADLQAALVELALNAELKMQLARKAAPRGVN